MVRPPVKSPTDVRDGSVDIWSGNSTPLFRVYHQDSYAPNAEAFRHFGPVSRYDHQLPRAGRPHKSASRGTIYLASDIGVALAEVFGESRPANVCPKWFVARVKVDGLLNIFDLTGVRVMHPGAYASIIGLDRDESQKWARKIYKDLPHVHGIRYVGSHDYGTCMVLWERAALAGPTGRRVVSTAVDRFGRRDEWLVQNPPAQMATKLTKSLNERKMSMQYINEVDCPICKDPSRHP